MKPEKLVEVKKESYGLNPCSIRPLVCVQGLGFVGAAMSVAVAMASDQYGKKIFDVLGVDAPTPVGKERAKLIKNGLFPFYGGDEKLSRATRECFSAGNLFATTDCRALSLADFVIVSVNLDIDFSKSPPVADFENYIPAIGSIGEQVSPDTLIIINTTIPPGTCERVILPVIQEAFEGRGFDKNTVLLAHSYERVMPGPEYLDSIINYWRVYSGINERSAQACKSFFEKVIDTKNFPLRRLSSTTASETAKIVENTYRAVNIALVDEWGIFAENVGVDLHEVIDAVRDRPTHSNIRQPGFGVGGYCLTKDPLFGQISNETFFRETNIEFPLATLAMTINQRMPLRNLERILGVVEKDPGAIRMLMMGVAYRSEVDDTRHSAAEIFYKKAQSMGVLIELHDPHVEYWKECNTRVNKKLPKPHDFDVIVFAVPHKYYREINVKSWLEKAAPIIFDCDKVLSNKQLESLRKAKLNVFSTGRGV